MPSTASQLSLGFTLQHGASRLTHVEQQLPWKVIRGFTDAAGTSLLHLQNVSGGLLSGDRLNAHVEVGAGCRVQLTTTGSTRIYRAKSPTESARQCMNAVVREGALLEYVPDSIIPFAGSRYRQRTAFELHAKAGLFSWEIVTPGRTGERLAFDLLELQTEISSEGEPIAWDRWQMRPHLQNLAQAIRMGSFTHQATMYACQAANTAVDWRRLENEMGEAACHLQSERQLWGVSALRKDGLVFRGLATEASYLLETCIAFWRRMKMTLYGVEPVLPRKLS